MASPVPCTSCGQTLLAHCESKGCRWLRCDKRGCNAHIFDLDHGVMTTLAGTVERLGSPPEPDYDGA